MPDTLDLELRDYAIHPYTGLVLMDSSFGMKSMMDFARPSVPEVSNDEQRSRCPSIR
jgi:hypothetical protein